MSVCKRFLLALIFVALTINISASPQCDFEHYSTEDGLPQFTIMDMLQDRKGFMWFGTWNGISRFDGYDFKNYKVQPGEPFFMRTSRVESIDEDRYGNIWIKSYDGEAVCFNTATERFWGINQLDDVNDNLQTWQISVMPSGLVWLLSEYNGCVCVADSVFTTYTFSSEAGNIGSDNINNVFEEKSGNWWLLTDNGLFVVDKETFRCSDRFYENHDRDKNKNLMFFSAFEESGTILFGSTKGFVFKYSKLDKRFDKMALSTKSNIVDIKLVRSNLLMLVTSDDGFFLWDQYAGSMRHFNTSNLPELSNNEITDVFIDNSAAVWFATPSSGIYRFDVDTETLNYYVVKTDDATVRMFPPVPFVIDDINGHLWVQPRGGGFSLYNKTTGKLDPFYNDPLSSDCRFSNILHSCYSDDQGNLWLCTRGHGLEKVVFSKSYFEIIKPNETKKSAVSNDVRLVFEDSDSNIWVSTKNSELTVYDKDYNQLGKFSTSGKISDHGVMCGVVYSAMQDRNGYIWLGTKGEGLLRIKKIDSKNYSVEQFKNDVDDEYSLSHNSIYNIYEDKNGRIWIGSYGGGINLVVNDENGNIRFLNYNNEMSGYPFDVGFRVRYVTEDNNDNICVGTSGGLIMFKTNFKSFEGIEYKHYAQMPNDISSLSNNDVHGVCITSENEMYIATLGGGVNKAIGFDKDGFPIGFKAYTYKEGLPSDVTLSIVEDQNKCLWISTENSLTRFSPETEVFESFSEIKRIMSTNSFSEASTCRISSGKLMFGFSGGVLSFDPNRIKNSTFVPNLVLSDFQIFNQDVEIGENSPLSVSIDNADIIELTHKQNSFSIGYAAIDYENPGSVLYAYKLDGFDKDWNFVQKQRIANYTNIPKGKYLFRVKSTNNEGVWIENERTLPITVKPSFWETIFAYCLYFLTFALLVSLGFYFFLRIYRLESSVKVEKRISEMKLRFFTDISHEIRTPLTMITTPIELILSKKDTPQDIRKQLELVSQNTGRMLRLVNQILDFRKAQFIRLKVEEMKVSSFLEMMICGNITDLAKEQGYEFSFDDRSNGATIWVDTGCFEKIVMNLLSNAFKFTPKGGSVKLSVWLKDKYVVVSVADNGKGIPKDKQKTIFERFSSFNDDASKPSTGIGLSMVKDLADKHSAEVTIESELGKGSTFNVAFLKGFAHFGKDVDIIMSDGKIMRPAGEQLETASLLPVLEEEENGEPQKNVLLIVEDDKDLRSFMKTIFDETYDVLLAEDGKEGFSLAKENSPDLVISDIMMPNVDGIQMLRQIRNDSDTNHIPVILLSAKTTIESKLEGLSYGADDYITKPFSVAYIQARVINILEQRKKLRIIYTSAIMSKNKEDYQPKPYFVTSVDDSLMNKVVELIEDNMDNSDFSVEELGRLVGMGRSSFFNKIKGLTGMSPVEFIRDIRIKRAAQLIASGQYLVKEAAFMSGFSDTKYFGKCFKAKYGVTPMEYKKKETN